MDQDRTINLSNEISDITETQGDAWATPSYDATGNMAGAPMPSDMTDSYDCTYDAWNRLVKVEDDGTVVAEYRYDGLGRRIRKYVYQSGSSDWDVQEYYYNASWQVLEVRLSEGVTRSGTPLSEPSVATTVHIQYVWSPRYIDSPVLRDRDTTTGGDLGGSGSGLDERLYYLTDANANVTAVVNTSGEAVERYAYDPYGEVTILNGSTGWRVSRRRGR